MTLDPAAGADPVAVRPAGAARAALHARSGLLAVSGGALLWGTTGVAVRIIGDRSGLAAVPIGCYRLAIAGVVLAAVFGRRGWSRLGRAWRQHRLALVLAGAGLGVYQALYFVGVDEVGVSVSTLVSLAVAPVALTLAAALRLRRAPRPAAIGTLVGAIGGLVLISLATGDSGAGTHLAHPLVGVLASLGSGLGYAATTVLNRRLAADADALVLTGASSAIGALVLVPVAVPFGLSLPHDAVADGWLLYIGVVSTVAAYWLFYTGLRSVTSEAAGVVTLLEPLAATILAVLVLHERLSALGWAGAGLLLVTIAALYVRRPEDGPAAL